MEQRLRPALADTPVVLLNGARQTGKSRMAEVVSAQHAGRYLTLDDPTQLAAARGDPASFVAYGQDALLVIDEVQKAPELFAAIKRSVDRDRRPGRFLLTGSADVLTLPQAAESLAGRMEILPLQPLARGEIAHRRPAFIDGLFANRPEALTAPAGSTVPEMVTAGGFPEVQLRPDADRRRAWFDAYVAAVTQRDIRDRANIADATALPRLLQLLAARSGALTNVAELARASGTPQVTLHRYLALLESSFLFQPLPAWHANLGKRLIKAPKAYLVDSGLACALTGAADAATVQGAPHFGGLLETWVLGELRREAAALPSPPRIYHYRSAGGVEVDFVLEDAAGRVAAVEVKATRSLGDRHFGGLRDLQAGLGDRFLCGVVLYAGEDNARFGDKLWAVPAQA
ncbi:MAG TPA: ATP-binding protein [Ramlibacter sp.]|uniref:ATP-binding protein n=1 Tax=Ramlibacter sp. TaxID=1917967 RepID=UPI002D806A5F|nr:ATP-binding protein [Ramlibacter sp.]HET8747802.1 ATP-binding protein [Ramlibacter sp.]